MKYTREYSVGSDKRWQFICPRDVAAAGIAKTTTFTDGRTARFEIPKLIELVQLYRSGELKEGTVGTHSLMVHLMNHYMSTDYYRQLAGSSQKQYQSVLESCLSTPLGVGTLGTVKVTGVNAKLCRELYTKWTKGGSITNANTKARILSVLLNYAVSIELLVNNPMAKVRKLKQEPVTKIWTEEQVATLLEVGYTHWNSRNITLITHMCYEYAQRPVDISRLTWDKVDLDDGVMSITQTKRGATVHLPIEEPLLSLLKQQKEDWDFQQWVVPHHIPSGSVYHPMNRTQMNTCFRHLKDLAGLPEDLHLGLLRKTAIVEMVDAGVDAVGIMNVSGHKNISSLNPYMKHTLKGAANALAQRKRT